MLLMNMEDTSTEDFDLQYLGFENTEGQSLPVEQLFSEQVNPAYVDDETLQELLAMVEVDASNAYMKLSAK